LKTQWEPIAISMREESTERTKGLQQPQYLYQKTQNLQDDFFLGWDTRFQPFDEGVET
jgi:hypothetical protein